MTTAVHRSFAANSTCHASQSLRFTLTSNDPPYQAMHPYQSRPHLPDIALGESSRNAPSVGSGLASGTQQAPFLQLSDAQSPFSAKSSQPRAIAPYPPISEPDVSPSFRPSPQSSTVPTPGAQLHSPPSRPYFGGSIASPAASIAQTVPAYTTSNSQSSAAASPANRSAPPDPAFMETVQTALPSRSNRNRCSLFIRQQPRAARAGPDGKDRRPIDPPPILQLLMHDFDPNNEQDVEEMKSQWWVVRCKLVSAEDPVTDVSTLHYYRDDGRKEVQRLLLGTTVATPTYTSDDPDPENMPQHPKTPPAPPSPTSRFLPTTSPDRKQIPQLYPPTIPGAFFIFADLSVRRAGDYRLQFSLIKMDTDCLRTGAVVHPLDTAVTTRFRVVNAKDFDQIQPSTNLVKGLLQRGAGFPLKLKKGQREGQRRRRQHSGDESDEDSYYNEN